MSKHIIIFIAVAMIGFAVNENIVVTAQTNSTDSDKQKIIVTWLETNDTKTIDTPVISVSGEDFWKIFEPMLMSHSNFDCRSILKVDQMKLKKIKVNRQECQKKENSYFQDTFIVPTIYGCTEQ